MSYRLHGAAITLLGAACFVVSVRAEPPPALLQTHSRSPYVHRLTLYDHDGTAISPEDIEATPYSPDATCSKCHPTGRIHAGWHFNAAAGEQSAGRPGEPWLLTDARTGTQIPLSYRGWTGTWSPAAVSVSRWEFVQRFGHHLPGGGIGQPPAADRATSAHAARWEISGTLETDCLVCHSTSQQHDPAEAERQIASQNLKWVPTAALGLAAIQGAAKNVPDDYDPFLPTNDPTQQPPQVNYDPARFDANERVFFDVTRRIPSERCYFCHSFHAVGAAVPPREHRGRDIHLTAGMLCVDCHRNGLDHAIVRGYAGEAAERNEPTRAAYSCVGCHYGTADPAATLDVNSTADAATALGGRHGAPRPVHAGLPPVHFELLTCTACHSGPWPGETTFRIQTALGHGLGLAARERTDQTPPHLFAPVFLQQADGKLAPHRLVWPSYWAAVTPAGSEPLPWPSVEAALADVFTDRDAHTVAALTDTEIAAGLTALTQAQVADAVAYIRDGERITLTDAGTLIREADPAAQPYAWPLGHDVRPAQQSLGIGGCTDCHSSDAPIYFGTVGGQSTDDSPQQIDLWGGGRAQALVWGQLYPLRPLFKWGGWACLLVAAVPLLRGRGEWTALVLTRGGWWLLAASGGVLALSGFVALAVWGRLGGWWLMVHTGVAPLFLLALPLLALTRPAESARTTGRATLLALGAIVAGTMLTAMLPLFGHADQHRLLLAHRYTGLVFLIVLVVFALRATRSPRRPQHAGSTT